MIERLRISGFRGVSCDIAPNLQVNWMVGPEGSGKSSILAALQHLFQGCNAWTDGRGSGAAEEISDGAKKAVIAATVKGVELERQIPSKKAPEIEAKPAVIATCLRSGSIFALPEAEQRSLFADVTGASDLDEVFIVRELNSWTPEIPDLGKQYLTDCTDVPMGMSLYKYAYDRRTEVNKTLKDAQGWLKAHPPIAESARLKTGELEKARAEYDVQLKAISARAGASVAEKREYEARVREWEAEVKARQAHGAELKFLESQLSVTDDSAEEKKWRDLAEITSELMAVRADLEKVRIFIDRLMSPDPCAKGICAKVEIQTARRSESEYAEKERKLREEQTAAEYGERRRKEKATQFASTRTRLTELHGKTWLPLGPKPEPPPPAQGSPAQPDPELLSKIREMEGASVVHEVWARDEKERASKAENVKKLERNALKWDCYTKAFAPAGIEAKALATRLEDLLVRVNADMEAFGFACEITAEPWSIRVQVPGKPMRPAYLLSHSESIRASVCFQADIAQMSGFGLIAVDEHGMGPDKRDELLDLLISLPVQSFVFSTLQSRDEEGFPLYPSAFEEDLATMWHLKEGRVTRA